MKYNVSSQIKEVLMAHKIHNSSLPAFGVKSISIVGSQARQELSTSITDLDLIIITEEAPLQDQYFLIASVIKDINSKISLPVSVQIFTEPEFNMMVSPQFMYEYLMDSKLILGQEITNNIKKSLLSVTSDQVKSSLTKRILFETYFFRQEILGLINDPDDENLHRKICKRLFWIAKNYAQLLSGQIAPASDSSWQHLLNDKLSHMLNERELSALFNITLSSVPVPKMISLVSYISSEVVKNYKVDSHDIW